MGWFLDSVEEELIENFEIPKMLIDYIKESIEKGVQHELSNMDWDQRIKALEDKEE